MSDTNEAQIHSQFGASGASRWRNCPGSVRVIAEAKSNGDIVEDTSTTYSREGDTAHDYAAKVLTGEMVIQDVPDEFREHLDGYIIHCSNVQLSGSHEDRRTMVEKPVALFYRPQDRGYVDHAVICPDFIHVTDLKYGQGIKVDAEDNDQGLIYTASLLTELEVMEGMEFDDDTPVYITVYQPRHYLFTGEPETWEITVGFLREQMVRIEKDYEAAKTATDEECVPSEKACRFCDAKGVCRIRAKTSFGGLPAALDIEADFDFEEDTKGALPVKAKDFDRETLTAGQVAWVCKNGSVIKKIIDDVEKAERERIEAGGEIRGVKLIAGAPGNRTWVDPKEAEVLVRRVLGTKEAYKPRQLLTAPQTLAKAKEHLDELSTIQKIKLGLADETEKTKCLIHRPPGKPKMVPVEHEAEALKFGPVEDDFDDLNDSGGIDDLL